MAAAESFLESLKAALARGELYRFTARGFSMAPFIKDEDILLIAPASRHVPRFGDVVAYAHPENGKLTVHRIVGMRKEGYIIKADNAACIDGVIPGRAIVGVAIRRERRSAGIRRVRIFGAEGVIIAVLSRLCVFPLVMYPLRRIAAMVRSV
ncbi:MAG TPA: S24/S26 family peptidase [Candidatus Omnitrophota bacterium]|nr:S24/S26 family peptidase [Candidatus Omnitrophota bacterium]HQO37613.1 S24/S26 family peptidase [Candidatus Omnitrophota bacterium]HQQ06457.1 S24/S26 family peptidase [Candidatus Omnitrophota bacterium]